MKSNVRKFLTPKNIVIALLAIAALVYFAAVAVVTITDGRYYVLSGPSMEPTLAKGQKIKIVEIAPSKIERGDIIVYENTQHNVKQIKRVVGIPGDKITDSKGVLVVKTNDNSTYKPYGDELTPDILELSVRQNSFYVVGDNRDNSLDSRINDYGLVSFDSVVGVYRGES